VVTIFLVVVLILLGLLCINYSFYFRSRIRSRGCIQLSYFSGPWIIRITFILFVIWWGCIQLSYFSGPWIFLTLAFLLRASLQEMELGILSRSWNGKTAGVSMQANGLHEKIFSFDMHMESLRRFLENI
jgi:hypothetical protein